MAIKNWNCKAISIDTSVFEKYQWLFDRGLLHTLKQFSDNEIDFVIPQVIDDEMKKHLSKAFDGRKRESKKGIKALKEFFSFNEDKFEEFLEQLDSESYPEDRLSDFYSETGAEVISCSGIDSEKLVKMYAEVAPPFEGDEDGPKTEGKNKKKSHKKHEFPDAIALLTLEKWAKEHGKDVLVVSRDVGWGLYAESSERIVVTDDLAEAIEYFQPEEVLRRLKMYFETEAINDYQIDKVVTDSLTNYIEEYEIYAEGYSDFIYEPDEMYASFDELVLTREKGDKLSARVVDIDDEEIVVELRGRVTYTLNASFSMYLRDSIDKDYVPMGSSSNEFQRTEDVEIVIHFVGEVAGDLTDLNVEYIEFSDILRDLDIGPIEPDWYAEQE